MQRSAPVSFAVFSATRSRTSDRLRVEPAAWAISSKTADSSARRRTGDAKGVSTPAGNVIASPRPIDAGWSAKTNYSRRVTVKASELAVVNVIVMLRLRDSYAPAHGRRADGR